MARLLGVSDDQLGRLHAELRAGRSPQLPGAVRASIGLGTTRADIDRLVGGLDEIARRGPAARYVHTAEHDEYRPLALAA
jgi:selenocysteine lyase/cysteine desulfurase